LRETQFIGANLAGVNFTGADLTGAVFADNADPQGITFKDANVANIRAPDSFAKAALARGAVVMRREPWLSRREELEDSLKLLWTKIEDPADSIGTARIARCRPAHSSY
jgi:uncharacterized protein YjbI with pentapeptide repeats